MRLLLDTQILVWMVNGDKRLRAEWVEAIVNPESSLHVSAVVAFEYSDLQVRQRIAIEEPISELMERFDLVVEVFPGRLFPHTRTHHGRPQPAGYASDRREIAPPGRPSRDRDHRGEG